MSDHRKAISCQLQAAHSVKPLEHCGFPFCACLREGQVSPMDSMKRWNPNTSQMESFNYSDDQKGSAE